MEYQKNMRKRWCRRWQQRLWRLCKRKLISRPEYFQPVQLFYLFCFCERLRSARLLIQWWLSALCIWTRRQWSGTETFPPFHAGALTMQVERQCTTGAYSQAVFSQLSFDWGWFDIVQQWLHREDTSQNHLVSSSASSNWIHNYTSGRILVSEWAPKETKLWGWSRGGNGWTDSPCVLQDFVWLLTKKYIRAMLVILIDDDFPPFLHLASSTPLSPSPPPPLPPAPPPPLYLSLLFLALYQLTPSPSMNLLIFTGQNHQKKSQSIWENETKIAM